MKQIFTLVVLLGFALSSYSQTFTNKPLITKRTADWCPNCGTWGWDFKLAILDAIPSDKATIIVAHHSGGLENPTSNAITNALGGVSQPRFYLNSTELSASSSNWNTTLDELVASVDEVNASIPELGIDLHAFYTENTGEVQAEIDLHVNQSVDGEYYLATYLLLDDLVWTQSGNSSDAVHKKLIHDVFGDEHFGQLIGNGPILEGVMNFDISDNFEIPEDIPTDVAVVIWKTNSTGYEVVTSAVVEDVQLLSNINEVNWVSDASLFYGNQNIQLELASSEAVGEYKIQLINGNGQIIQSKDGFTSQNEIRENFETSALISGTYYVQVLSSNGLWSDKVFVVK